VTEIPVLQNDVAIPKHGADNSWYPLPPVKASALAVAFACTGDRRPLYAITIRTSHGTPRAYAGSRHLLQMCARRGPLRGCLAPFPHFSGADGLGDRKQRLPADGIGG
jgi:hypothetical protein